MLVGPALVLQYSDVLFIIQAFLGDQESKEFSLWLWELLRCVEAKQPFVERPAHNQSGLRHAQSAQRANQPEPFHTV